MRGKKSDPLVSFVYLVIAVSFITTTIKEVFNKITIPKQPDRMTAEGSINWPALAVILFVISVIFFVLYLLGCRDDNPRKIFIKKWLRKLRQVYK